MQPRLFDKVALVTGGSRGIGAAIVHAFASEGADVAFCHNANEDEAAAVTAAVERYGRRVFAIRCDVSDIAAVSRLPGEVKRRFGRIDILVNNAGISGEVPFERISLDMFDAMISVNLRALFQLSQLVVPEMRERGWGRIINIASQLAYSGAPGLVHYCAAKAGVLGLTRAMGVELAPQGVLVNAIAPGLVDTRLNDSLTEEWKANKLNRLPIGRMGRPEEIAPTAVMLASCDGDFYVGQTLSPNGGDVLL